MTTTGPTAADAPAAHDEIFTGPRAQELVEDAEKIAAALIALGERVRAVSKRFTRVDPVTGAVAVVADMQSDVMQGTGAIGSLFWTLVTDAGAYDRDRQFALTSSRSGRKRRLDS
jgi:hypothetical protein